MVLYIVAIILVGVMAYAAMRLAIHYGSWSVALAAARQKISDWLRMGSPK